MLALIQNMSIQRTEELRADGARRRLAARLDNGRRRRWGFSSSHRRPAGSADAGAGFAARLSGYSAHLAIRRLDREADRPAIERVAGRDTTAVPDGELLGAELDGVLVAAMSTETGRVIADPFAHSAEAVVLLRRRAEQIRAAEGHGGGLSRRLLRRPLRRAG
jgi:hypothetical protein